MNLVSNQAGAALLQDPALNLPWGVTVSPTSGDLMVDNAGSGVVTMYGGGISGNALTQNPVVVHIPGGAPTADVFNDTNSSSDFTISGPGGSSAPATFVFASLDGRISAWNSSVSQNQAQQVVQVHGAFFTGLAIGNNESGNFLYAADFQHGKIDVFDGSFHQTTLAGNFSDPNLPAGYAPFNIQSIGGKLYVTYAVQQASSQNASDQDGDEQGDNNQEDATHGHGHGDSDNDEQNGGSGGVFTPAAKGGIVDVFDMNGNFLKRFATDGDLNAPWGLAMAPASFGQFSGDLLVANFGDGRITAYDPNGTFDAATGAAPVGQLTNAAGDPISIHHLLGLSFGNGATAGDANTLYFTADAASLSATSGGLGSTANGIVLLDGAGQGALREVGNANVNVANGGITVDSNDAGAIFLAGNPQLTASQLNIVGSPGLTEHGHPSVNVSGGVNANAAVVNDPLASLSAPIMPGNSSNAVNANNQMSQVLQPGVYNGGINVTDNAVVTLQPGVYYLQGGGISVDGNGMLQGQGVTIYIASTGGGPALKVSGHGQVNLTAASSGDLQGIAIFLARADNDAIDISGRGTVNLTGSLYAPGATISVDGNGKLLLSGNAGANISSQLVAADLNVAGNGDVDVQTLAGGAFSLLGSLQPFDNTTSPLVGLGATLTATEGQVFQAALASFAASAANAVGSDFTATINWGDHTSSTGSVTATGNGGFLISGTHTFAEQGAQSVSITLNDGNGHTITIADTVQVADAPLLAVGNLINVSQGTSASGVTVASFVDTGGADAAGDYTANIDWGDGASSAGTVTLSNGTLNVTGSHSYSAAGQFPVKVTIKDEGGATATANSVAALGVPTDDDVFISDAFEDILERAVDRASLLFFINALQNGMTRQQLASLLTHSDEYLDNKIEQDYQHYLGRDADDNGLAYWRAQLRGGMTDEQVESLFIGSPEYFQHAGGTDQDWVQEMYFDLLGRLPDNSGLNYWLQVLAGGGSRALVADGFAASSEREGIIVRDDYQTYLGRTPGPSEVNQWVANFHQGTTNEQVVAGFVGSQEYFQHHGGGKGPGNGGNGQGNGGGNDNGSHGLGNGNDNGNGKGNDNGNGKGDGNGNDNGNGNGHGHNG